MYPLKKINGAVHEFDCNDPKFDYHADIFNDIARLRN